METKEKIDMYHDSRQMTIDEYLSLRPSSILIQIMSDLSSGKITIDEARVKADGEYKILKDQAAKDLMKTPKEWPKIAPIYKFVNKKNNVLFPKHEIVKLIEVENNEE